MNRVIALALVLAVVGACRSQTITVIPSAELPRDIYQSPPPTPTQGVEGTFQIYFVQGNQLTPVQRTSHDKGSLEEAMRLLLEGATVGEQQSGLASAIPLGVELLSARMSGSTASIDLTSEFESEAEEQILLLRLAQVVFTATALPEVEKVRFLIDSEPSGVLIANGTVVTRPVTRSDY